MKIVDYRILSANAAHLLVKQVRDLLPDGWQPFGSLAVDSFEKGGRLFSQAVVKYETPKRPTMPQILYATAGNGDHEEIVHEVEFVEELQWKNS